MNVRAARMILAVAMVLLVSAEMPHAQDDAVRISFDRHTGRIDMMTGKQLPDYTRAQRGSFQFFNGRLDTPERGFWYEFDGRRFQPVERTLFMRKIKSIGTWVIAGTSRFGDEGQFESGKVPTEHPNTNCEIEHHAVSFVPLNPATGEPEGRVYVLLEDLDLIQWGPYDHWLVNVSQEELEAMQGTVY